MIRIVSALLCFTSFSPALAGGQETKDNKAKGPPASQLLDDGLAKAKKESKAVFLDFSTPT